MKIWYSTTTAAWKEYRKTYLLIREKLLARKMVLLFDWMPDVDNWLMHKKGRERQIEKIYKEVNDALLRSEAVIIEYTVPNFSSSHQIMMALMKRKPTLILRQKNDNQLFRGSYLDSMPNDRLTVATYTPETLDGILNEFLHKSSFHPGFKRYNLVLDEESDHYLTWLASQQKKSRSEVLRAAILQSAAADENYKNSWV